MKPQPKERKQRVMLFQTLYLQLPFQNMSELEMVTVPFWRLLADNAIVIIQTEYTYTKTAFDIIRHYGLRYYGTFRTHPKHKASPVIIGLKGSPEVLHDLSLIDSDSRGILDHANTWGSPKLAVNVIHKNHRSTFNGWLITSPTGSKKIDPFYFPLRRNNIDINESLYDLVVSIKSDYQNQILDEWKIIERLAIIIMNLKISQSEVVQLLRSTTSVSHSVIRQWIVLIHAIHDGRIKPDFSKPVSHTLRVLKHLE